MLYFNTNVGATLLREGSRAGRLRACRNRLMKTGGRLVKHARYYWLLLAEGHLNRRLFGRHVAEDLGAACAGRVTPTARTASVRGLPRIGAGEVLPKSPLRSPARHDRADSKAGVAAKGVPNVVVVRKPLQRGGDPLQGIIEIYTGIQGSETHR